MAAQLFRVSSSMEFTSAGLPAAGANLYFYEPGTLTPKDAFTTSALNVAHAHPIVANGAGRITDVFLDSAQMYRYRITDRNGVLLDDVDDYIPGTTAGAELLEPYATAAADSAAEAGAAETATLGYRDEAEGFRDESEGFRGEAEDARDQAALSAVDAGQDAASAFAATAALQTALAAGGSDVALRADLVTNSGFTLIKHKSSLSGTYARSAAERAELGAQEADGHNLIEWINPTFDDALLDGDYSDDLTAYIDNALAELRFVEAATARSLVLTIPPHSFRHDAGQIQLDIPNLTLRTNGGRIVSGLATNNALFMVTGEGVKGRGVRSLLTAAATLAHHWDIRGDKWVLDDCHWDYDTPQNTPSGYIRQADDGVARFCSARGANAVLGYIEGSRNLFIGNKFYAEAGGDDPFALKAFNQSSVDNQFIGNYLEGFATGISLGSQIGKSGADDASHEFYVLGTVFDSNVLRKCGSLTKVRPGGGTTDYRDGYAELSASNNRLIDLAGEKMGSIVQLIPGRNGDVGSVTGKNNTVIGRFASSAQHLISAAFGTTAPAHINGPVGIEIKHRDPWSGAANGALITAVGALGPDPAYGYDVGEAVPGYPLESATSINATSLTIADKAFILNIEMDGSAINGGNVGSNLNGKVAVEKFHAQNYNATNGANAAGFRTRSRVELLTDNLSMPRTSKIHASTNNAYRCENGTDGEIICNTILPFDFGDVAAGSTKKRTIAWANRSGLYLAKVTGVNAAAVAAAGGDYLRLGIYDPDNSNTLIDFTNTSATGLTADEVRVIAQASNLAAADQHKLHFDRNERIQLEKSNVGSGAATTDFRGQLHVAPF